MFFSKKNENAPDSPSEGSTFISSDNEESRADIINALKESEEKFRVFADESPNMVFINRMGKIVYANKTCEKITGYTREDFYSPSFNFHVLHAPESIEIVREAFKQHMMGKNVDPYEYKLKTKDGRMIEAVITTKLIEYKGSRAILGIVTDISRQKAVERALRESESTYRLTINALCDAMHTIDRKYRIILYNKALLSWHERFGLQISILGRMLSEVYPFLGKEVFEEYRKVFETGQPLVTEELNEFRREKVYTETRKIPVLENGQVKEIITVMRDITEIKNREKQLFELNKELIKSNLKLKELSLTDAHTGLFNHKYLGRILQAELSRAKRENAPLSLLKVDIDYFKSVNDLYGHQFGDIVLKQLAHKLKKLIRKYNIITRYGGEEFVILSPNTTRIESMALGQRIIDAINLENFGTKSKSVKLRLSVAISSYPEDKIIKAGDMIEAAERCINTAKELGGNRLCTSEDAEAAEKKNGKKTVKTRADFKYMKEKIDKLTKRANQSLIESIFAFAKTIELKDHYTGEHVERTVKFATDIARAMGLSGEDTNMIKQAAILHDLGKVGISEKILLKRSKLTNHEFKEIKSHPMIGADIIRPIHLLHDILPYIMYHHERWDGKGYPVGLKGEEIPMGARIIALADTFQALMSNRPYRKAYSRGAAIKIIRESSGSHFDPVIVNAFLKVMKGKA